MNRPVDYFNQGRLARQDGLPLTACQLRFKAWPYQAWCLGWHLAEIEANVDAGKVDAEPLENNAKTPLDQGFVAHKRGLHLQDNPYDPGSREFGQWELGWREASDPLGAPRGVWHGCLILAAVIIIAAVMWALWSDALNFR